MPELMTTTRAWHFACWTVCVSSIACGAYGQVRPVNFGQQWVRTHPLTLMGLQQTQQTLKMDKFLASNMNNMLVWWNDGNGKSIAAASSAAGMPWQALIVDGEGDERDRMADYASVGNNVGWMLDDEPSRQQLPFFGDLAAWTRANRPNDLVYTNALPTYATAEQLFGNTVPAGGYSYHQYLEDIVDIIKPDLLMYDHYPFFQDGSQRADYFVNLMAVREVAREHNLPYWGFMQASQHGAYRLPSQSDARFQMYSHLAAGYTGMGYFTFDSFGTTSILDPNGNPSALYPVVTDLNKEAANLGRALRFMTSDSVQYVLGRHVTGSTVVNNDLPAGMTAWSAASDSDDHILSIFINSFGTGLDGILGCFTDDAGRSAFMLMNANHGAAVPSGSQLTFVITFDNSINEVLRLDRTTGQQVLVPLTNHQLGVTLPAGTGELFKYNDGNFVLAVPEPGCAGLLSLALVSWCIRLRRVL